jgi:osmotically inducible protein OsmC
VPGLDAEQFQSYAEAAKATCPVSRALAGIPEISLMARLADPLRPQDDDQGA